jgi:hypothetical protein
MTAPTYTRRELAHRAANGIEVTLLWTAAEDQVALQVVDTIEQQAFELVVDRGRALEAFHHPFVYAARPADAGRVGGVTTWHTTGDFADAITRPHA